MVHVPFRSHRDCNSINIQEGITGKEHLAEICPGVMVRVGFGSLGVDVIAGLAGNRRAAFSSSGPAARLKVNWKARMMRDSSSACRALPQAQSRYQAARRASARGS